MVHGWTHLNPPVSMQAPRDASIRSAMNIATKQANKSRRVDLGQGEGHGRLLVQFWSQFVSACGCPELCSPSEVRGLVSQGPASSGFAGSW